MRGEAASGTRLDDRRSCDDDEEKGVGIHASAELQASANIVPVLDTMLRGED